MMFKKNNNDFTKRGLFNVCHKRFLAPCIGLIQPVIEKALIFFYAVEIQVDKHFSLTFKEF